MMAWFERLSTREKGAVVLALALALILGGKALVGAVFGDSSGARRLLELRRDQLTKMEALANEYRSAKGAASAGATALKPGETLYAFLDEVAGSVGIRSKVSYMKPSSIKSRDGKVSLSVVEMKVVDLPAAELTSFLHRVESAGDLVRVRAISLTRIEKSKLLTAVISIETVIL
ncbi:type II secretion system protein GspM [Desulfoluna butyratoxydans]|uniref:Type ii secretion system protein m n=1 Tax=Desulfoluna butyratoxydans TaxID=231438 RepID=A0A4U8YR56_9BACT|nr:type II secretion system protein GspM [Desulfoluna butyratoxydans]VFQ46350.1 type ii secretion system protein m [Desulfoluna butyratoxydans]